jgi:hypothetical protein
MIDFVLFCFVRFGLVCLRFFVSCPVDERLVMCLTFDAQTNGNTAFFYLPTQNTHYLLAYTVFLRFCLLSAFRKASSNELLEIEVRVWFLSLTFVPHFLPRPCAEHNSITNQTDNAPTTAFDRRTESVRRAARAQAHQSDAVVETHAFRYVAVKRYDR